MDWIIKIAEAYSGNPSSKDDVCYIEGEELVRQAISASPSSEEIDNESRKDSEGLLRSQKAWRTEE